MTGQGGEERRRVSQDATGHNTETELVVIARYNSLGGGRA